MSAGCVGISHTLYDAGICPRNHASLLACNVQEPKLVCNTLVRAMPHGNRMISSVHASRSVAPARNSRRQFGHLGRSAANPRRTLDF
jgi:hypothetical protein